MKTKSLFLVLFALALVTFTSCELFEKADDVTFNVSVPLDFVIDENADNPGGASYSDTELLDATTDPEIAKYADKINKIEVERITYTISNADPSSVVFSGGSLMVASNSKIIATASSVSLSNTAETELTADLDGFNDLAARLLDDKQETVMLNGTLSETPVSFNVRFRFYLKITADAL